MDNSYMLRDIEGKIAELEEVLGGYVGEGNLVDELDWVISEVKDVVEAAKKQQDSILDPKGHVVLAEFDHRDSALVFTNPDSPEPYVIAYRYDKETGEWAYGSYYSDLSQAWDDANPEILASSVIKWQREDLEAALREQGVEPSKENVSELAWRTRDMRYWREDAIADGNEFLRVEAYSIGKELKKEKQHSPVSLGDRVGGVKEVSQEVSSFDAVSRTINER